MVVDKEEIISGLKSLSKSYKQLDGHIFKFLNKNEVFEDFDGVLYMQDKNDKIAYESPPDYTSSIDTALKLFNELPRDLHLYLRSQPDMGSNNYCVSCSYPRITVSARSWPIALSVVALTIM